jgi:hypothetical protein
VKPHALADHAVIAAASTREPGTIHACRRH